MKAILVEGVGRFLTLHSRQCRDRKTSGSEDLIIHPNRAVHLIMHFTIENEGIKSVVQGTGDRGELLGNGAPVAEEECQA